MEQWGRAFIFAFPPTVSYLVTCNESLSFNVSVFRFGSIMIENMRSRDCELPGVLACPTLADQEKRFTEAGFSNAKVNYIICSSVCIGCLIKLLNSEKPKFFAWHVVHLPPISNFLGQAAPLRLIGRSFWHAKWMLSAKHSNGMLTTLPYWHDVYIPTCSTQ